MTTLRVQPIVEGHGEVEAIRLLLTRVWTELLGQEYCEVLRPIRKPKGNLVKPEDLSNAIDLADLKIRQDSVRRRFDRDLILLLLDADNDAACELAPELVIVGRSRTNLSFSCVIAVIEYETWFVAAARSLSQYLDLTGVDIPHEPETGRNGKGWIERHFRGPGIYSETIDQPRMSSAFDLADCRNHSPSFDKLCRDLEALLS